MNYWNDYFNGKDMLKKDNKKQKKVAFVLAFLLLNSLTKGLLIKKTDISKETIFENDNKYTVADLYAAIYANNNLDNTEKLVLKNSWELLSDYEDYIDFNLAINQLSNFDIKYVDEKRDGQISVNGTWNYKTQEMTLYNLSKKEDILKYESPANHELCHLINEKGEYYPQFLIEAINSLFSSEYFEQENAYIKQKIVIEMLCEIIEPKVIAKSYLQDDYQLIISKLKNIDDDQTLIYELNNCFEEYQTLYDINKDKYGTYLDNEEKKEFLTTKKRMFELLNKINVVLCHYYNKKYNTEINSNFEENNDVYFLDNNSIMNLYSTKLIKDDDYYDNEKGIFYSENTLKTTTSYFNERNLETIKCKMDSGKYKTFRRE